MTAKGKNENGFDDVLKRMLQTPPDPKVKQSKLKAKSGQKAKKKPA